MIEKLAILIAGLAGGITIVVACSDDTQTVDAGGTCECPDAEPPLAGRVVMLDNEVTTDSDIIVAVSCPDAALVLGGGCEITGPNGNSMVLYRAGGNSGTQSYGCEWENPGAAETTGRAWATCLLPAEAK